MTKQEWKFVYGEMRSMSKPELKAFMWYIRLLKTDRPRAMLFYNFLFGEKEETVSIN